MKKTNLSKKNVKVVVFALSRHSSGFLTLTFMCQDQKKEYILSGKNKVGKSTWEFWKKEVGKVHAHILPPPQKYEMSTGARFYYFADSLLWQNIGILFFWNIKAFILFWLLSRTTRDEIAALWRFKNVASWPPDHAKIIDWWPLKGSKIRHAAPSQRNRDFCRNSFWPNLIKGSSNFPKTLRLLERVTCAIPINYSWVI